MVSISANELKTRGIFAAEDRVEAGEDVIVSVREQDRFVFMSLEKYDRLREFRYHEKKRAPEGALDIA